MQQAQVGPLCILLSKLFGPLRIWFTLAFLCCCFFFQGQNYQLWKQQSEGLAPVIGDGLLGGKSSTNILVAGESL